MSGLTIFKEIISIDVSDEPIEVQEMYHEIYDFIFSGVWTKSEKIKSMLPIINEDALLIAKKQGITKTNVLATRSQASNKLRKILGKNIHEKLISRNKIEYQNFRINMQCAIVEVLSIDEIIPLNFLSMINSCTNEKEYKVSECSAELAFLASICIPSILDRLESLDRDKLDFIIGVLTKPNHFKVQKGSRQKNTLKFEMLGQILYIAKYRDLASEYQKLKKEEKVTI